MRRKRGHSAGQKQACELLPDLRPVAPVTRLPQRRNLLVRIVEAVKDLASFPQLNGRGLIEAAAPRAGSRAIVLDLVPSGDNDCAPHVLQLHRADFQPANVETHVRPDIYSWGDC
jgi:hypothetical protein